MPDPYLSEAIKEAYASAPVDTIIYHTLEIIHSDFTEPIRIVRDFNELTATLEDTAPYNPGEEVTFIPYAFEFQPPEINTQGVVQCQIEIDNVDRVIFSALDTAITSYSILELIYRGYLSDDLTGPQNDPPLRMTITSVSAGVSKITATASFGNFANRKFPNYTYTTENFPYLTNG